MSPAPAGHHSHASWRAEIVDELVAHPDVWQRIAEHAEAAAVDRADGYGRDVLVALSGCARVLAAGGAA